MKILEASNGASDEAVAMVLGNLGSVLLAQGKTSQASEMLGRAVTSTMEALGIDHPDVAMARYNHANALLGESKTDQAREQFEKSLAIMQGRTDNSPRLLGSVLASLGLLAEQAGDQGEAAKLMERALSAMANLPAFRGEVLLAYSKAAWEQGDHARARTLASTALEALESTDADIAQARIEQVRQWQTSMKTGE